MLAFQDDKSETTKKNHTYKHNSASFETYISQFKVKPYPEPRGPLAKDVPLGGSLPDTNQLIQNKKDEEEKNIQAENNVQFATDKTDSATKANNTGLPDNLKSGVEKLSGISMDNVKVHYNSGEPLQLQAHAYTQGSAIYVAPGKEEYLPHEAWHVVQQSQGRVAPTRQMKGKVNLNEDAELENEADVKGREALQTDHFENRNNLAHNKGTKSEFPVQAIVQRAPSDFKDSATLLKNEGLKAGGLFGLTFNGMSPWYKILTDLDAYAALSPEQYSIRKAKLDELERHIAEWRAAFLERRENPKAKDNEKKEALIELETELIEDEKTELSVALKGSLISNQNPVLSADPEITKSTFSGVLANGTQVYIDKGLTTPQETSNGDTPCYIMMETETAYQIQFVAINYQSIIPTFAWKVRWVAKAKVAKSTTESISEPRTDTRYENKQAMPLFPHKPHKEDVKQGGLGDCYLLAALTSVVDKNPDFITGMMKDNDDGSVTIRLYNVDSTQAVKQFAAREIRVSKTIVKSTITGGDEFALTSLWVQLLEKAYVAGGYVGTENGVKTNNSFGKIEGGYGSIALEHLIGQSATRTDIVKQKENPVPAASSPWGDAEKHNYEVAKNLVEGKEQAYRNLISHNILKNIGNIDTWMTFVNAHNIETEVKARAQKGNGGYKAEIRLEDFARYFDDQGLDKTISGNVVAWLKAEKYYPGKRGTANYTDSQLNLYQQIRNKLNGNKHVILGSDKNVARARSGFGHSAGEPMSKGLVGKHEYAVLGINPNKNNTELKENEVIKVLLRNPWAEYGRVYKTVSDKVKALADAKAAESWLDLSDITKRFDAIYTTD